ncbi:hypothetical protein BC938DRAFT_480864 [Jimgerdemannia flammicorona]|uniref:Pentacotripeptide-repeat region of PRORP domain-containing protein n=1 Tax=Jimgerdemannia flammicorona TaxID=994334 RepID=A0A433QHI6_9FUNG|nr:hypothetical protein BC938DRAFT_480864 [Jimgerdemannia flammicorona]
MLATTACSRRAWLMCRHRCPSPSQTVTFHRNARSPLPSTPRPDITRNLGLPVGVSVNRNWPSATSALNILREELYTQPSPIQHIPTGRRSFRQRLWHLYTSLHNDPLKLLQLTREDIRALVSVYASASATPPVNLNQALQILEDLQRAGYRLKGEELDMKVAVLWKLRKLEAVMETMEKMQNLEFVPAATSYTAAVYASARIGMMEAATKWMEKMRGKGYTLSEDTYAAMMEGYTWNGDVKGLVEICEQMAHQGIIREVEISNDIVSDSEEAGSHDLAKETTKTRRLVDRAFNHVMTYFIEQNNIHRAQGFYSYKRHLGLPTDTALRRLVEACYQFSETKVLQTLLDKVLAADDWRAGRVVSTALLDHFLAQEDLQKAVTLYDQLRRKRTGSADPILGVHSYVDLLCNLSDSNMATDAMKVYRDLRTFYPSKHLDIDIYNRVLSGLIHGKAYLDARLVHRDLLTDPFVLPNVYTYNALLHLCAQTGSMRIAERLVSEMVARGMPLSHDAYSCLMACHVEAGDSDGATRVFRTMIDAGFMPDVVDFNVLIRAHADPVKKVMPILQQMRDVDVRPDSATYRTLYQAYLNAGQFEDAEKVLQAMADGAQAKLQARTKPDEPMPEDAGFIAGLDTRTLNTLLTQRIREEGIMQVAHEFLTHELDSPDKSDRRLDMQTWMTFKILLDAAVVCVRYMPLAKRIKYEMVRRGYKPGKGVYVQMVGGWAKKGQFSKARMEMKEMEEEAGIPLDVEVYTALVDGYLEHGFLKRARMAVVEEMVGEKGIEPDEVLMERLVRKHMKVGDRSGLGELVKGLQTQARTWQG